MNLPPPSPPLLSLGFTTAAGADPDAFRALARRHAAGVTVVTTVRPSDHTPGAAPLYDGFTATAFVIVSMAPPIVLVSATNASSAMAMLRDAEAYVVNLLSIDQRAIADVFATPHADRDAPFDALPWAPDADGVPVLGGTLGAFSARVRQHVPAGDHTLVLGDVTALHRGPDAPEALAPLVYLDRAYGRVART